MPLVIAPSADVEPAPWPAPARHRRGAWSWPLVLALVFAGAVGGWLQHSDVQDAEDERRLLISDALTLQSRLGDWMTSEQAAMATLAAALPAQVDDVALLREQSVNEGLRRLWISVTVLDAGYRLVAHVPQQAPRPDPVPTSSGIDDHGVSAHLSTPMAGGGHLVVRFAPATLLRQTVPWWLSRRYDVRLIDGSGQLIAATGDTLPDARRQSYRVSVEPAMADAYLELTSRETRTPWWRTLPMALMLAFVSLSAAASWSLRRQMRGVLQAERQSRTEAAWRRAIEDSLTVGLRGRDMDGRLVHVNRAFCDLIGFTPEQLLGRLPPMPYWPADTMDDSMERHRRNMAGNAPREGYEARWVHADGHEIDVMIFEAPLVDAQGQHMGWMGSIVDITARKRSQEREQRQLDALAKQARLTTLGEVASALAHQLNQPLAALAAYNSGVLRSLERSGYPDTIVLDALRRADEQVTEAGRIVARIRSFLTRRAPQREPTSLHDMVQRTLALLRRDLQGQGIEVAIQWPGQLPPVQADPVLIEQVLINLVRNAMDALAGRDKPRIAVSAHLAGTQFVRLDVDDNGSGLGGRGVDEISAPFHSTKHDGMGMGLAICRSVIEAHHGALDAGPSPMGGARLSFTLPVADEAATDTRSP